MEQAKRRGLAPRAKPGTPRTPSAGGAGAPGKPLSRQGEAAPPDLLCAALMCNADQCPPDAAMQACRYAEEYTEGICADCWMLYFYWLEGHCRRNPYTRGGGVD